MASEKPEASRLVHAWAAGVCRGAAPQLAAAVPPTRLEPACAEAVAVAVAVAVEKRLRTVLDAAAQRCRRRRGQRLSGDDLNDALEALGDERVLGHPRRSLVATLNGSAALEPKELDLDAVEAEARQRALVAAPPEAALALSWLSVDGRDAREDVKTNDLKTPPLRREQELYLKAVNDALRGECDEARRREVFRSLRRDAGLRPLAPHLAALASREAKAAHRSTRPCGQLRNVATFIRSLAMNPGAGIEFHLHQLVPAALTLVVAKVLGGGEDPDHWLCRVEAARCVAAICEEFGDRFADLRPRVVQTLCEALDGDKPFATKYGALECLVALGPAALNRYAEPRLASLATTFAALPESDAKQRCLDAVVRSRRGLRGAAPGSCFDEQVSGAFVDGWPKNPPPDADQLWRAVTVAAVSSPPRRFREAAAEHKGKRKRGNDGETKAGRVTRPAAPDDPVLEALGERAVALADSGGGVFI